MIDVSERKQKQTEFQIILSRRTCEDIVCSGKRASIQRGENGSRTRNEDAERFFSSVNVSTICAAHPSLTDCLGASQYTWRYFDCLILNIFDCVLDSWNNGIDVDYISVDFRSSVGVRRNCMIYKFPENSLDLYHCADLNLLLIAVVLG